MTKSAPHRPLAGVMDARYAHHRSEDPAYAWRYRIRAAAAVAAYRSRCAHSSGHRVLDLGAADGLTLLEMRELLSGDGHFRGVDLSTELLATAPELPANVALLEGDVTRLPETLEAGNYDLCTVLAVLEHVEDPRACLAEAHRMLCPGGVLVSSCPRPFWDGMAERLGMGDEEHHVRRLSAKEMSALARSAGFERIEARPFMWAPLGLLPYVGLAVAPVRALDIDGWIRRSRLLSPGLVNQLVVAQKPAG